MQILVLNAGSSSLKCTLFRMPERRTLATGTVEKVGEEGPVLHFECGDGSAPEPCEAPTHERAFEILTARLSASEGGPLENLDAVDAVGHRIVHGGEASRSVRIDAGVIEMVRRCAEMAPLHNPYNLAAVEAAMRLLPDRPHVAVFDTAFHASMPPRAYLYAVPRFLYAEHRVRVYGFHGTSFRYVTDRAARMLGRPREELNLIALHLGNGCSAVAVRNGVSVDTSMGMTPLQGLVMGTRCGDVDPGLPFLLNERLNLSPAEVYYDLLNRRGGLLGLSGVSNDMRDVLAAARGGDRWAETALEVFAYRARKYIGAYCAALGAVDALVFTAGIGENSPEVRRRCCQGLEGLGIALDPHRNEDAVGRDAIVSPDGAAVTVMVVPTDEALQIALETHELLQEDRQT